MKITYCQYCGEKLDLSGTHPKCPGCGVVVYNNPIPTGCAWIVEGNNVLLTKRALEPYKGEYSAVGGFVEPNETPEQAAIREAQEETGLEIRLTGLLGTFIDLYAYGEDKHTLNFHYTAEKISGTEQANDDVAALEWVPITAMPEIKSFENVRQAAKVLQEKYKHLL